MVLSLVQGPGFHSHKRNYACCLHNIHISLLARKLSRICPGCTYFLVVAGIVWAVCL